MYSRAPVDYICPFCSLVERGEDEFGDRKDDIVFSDEFLTAFVSSHWWPNVNGAVLVIPNKHYENIFDISDEYYVKVQLFAKHLAPIMMKAYSCKGISTRQHNVPVTRVCGTIICKCFQDMTMIDSIRTMIKSILLNRSFEKNMLIK